MNKTPFFLVIAFLLMGSFNAQALSNHSEQATPGQPTNYVVIGAFSIKRNAERFTSSASAYQAKFEINKNRNLYYVYVLMTDDTRQALTEARRLRKESSYTDTWVFHGVLGEEGDAAVQGTDIHPDTRDTFQPETPPVVVEEEKDTTAVTQPVTEPVSEPADEPEADISSKQFMFQLYRADNQTEVPGDVTVVDTDKTRKMGTYEGNRMVRVSNPNNKSGNITLLCDVFGYRKMQKDVKFLNPEGEGITTGENQEVVVPFELVRLQKGDIAVMYNVFFYKDAALMRPESRFEVNQLLAMLQENPKYKIVIHGHTNGNASGKIISMGKDGKDFFSLTNTSDGFGSAKKLSEVRASTVKQYLVSQGIDPERMKVKAWGGKRPLVDKMHTTAQSNVRVEIEILEN
jgi:outer membrane protein OmpA-like peptidoglycan-associated protein